MTWLTELENQVGAWPLAGQAAAAAACAVLVLAALAGALRWRSKDRAGWLTGIGPQAIVALGGVAVSVHGLWGFATDTAGLPLPLRVGFIATFDAAELVLLAMLYRAADPAVGWTRELRLMHRTAWTLVGFSAAMNAVHAPNWWARPVLAAVPMLAAWLIELQLRAKLHTAAAAGHQDCASRPGPARLVGLLWQHGWAAVFAALGLDARTSQDAISQAARVQRAARRCYQLRLALEAREVLRGGRNGKLGRATKRITALRAKTQKALDRADIATDSAQALAFARRLAALTRADDIARLDFTDAPAVLALLEDLNLTASAARIQHAARAADHDAARRGAEAELATLAEEIARATRARDDLLSEIERAGSEAEEARQGAATARQEEAAAREERDRAGRAAEGDAASLRSTVASLREQAGQARADRDRLAREAHQMRVDCRQASAEANEARLLRQRLCGELPEHQPGGGSGHPEWRSEAKQAGWQRYLDTLRDSHGRQEPSAAQLADLFGIDPGNARNWLRDFRATRAAQLAAVYQRQADQQPALT